MKRIYFFCAALIVLALFASCSGNKEQQESKPECFIHYTPDTLDGMTAKTIEILRNGALIPKTQEQIDSILNAVKDLPYEQYAGSHPAFSEGTTVDTLVDENGYITLKITRQSTEDGAKLPEANLIYLHGGGFMFAMTDMHRSFCEAVAERMNCTVYIVLYPLAPKYYVQTTLDMILGVYRTLRKEDKPLYVMGDSAGANITLTFGLYLKDINEQLPDALLSISPFCDFSLSNPEILEYNKNDVLVSMTVINEIVKHWHPADMDLKDPRVSPLYGDWKGMCQTYLFIGTDETLYPDFMEMRQKMEDAGVRVGTLVGRHLFHVAPEMVQLPVCDQYFQEITEFLYNK